MTTPLRIQLHDPDHPRRTILRIAFWLVVIALLVLLIHSCAGSRDDALTERVPAPKAKEKPATHSPVVVVPASNTKAPAAPSSRKPRLPAAKPPAQTKTPATRQPSRTPTPARPTSRPQPPRTTTPRNDSEPAMPIPPAPSGTSTGGAGGGATSTTGTGTTTPTQPEPTTPTPQAPKPPSNHNCDAANETC